MVVYSSLVRKFGIAIVCALTVRYGIPVVEPAIKEYLKRDLGQEELLTPQQSYREVSDIERMLEEARYVP